MLQEKTRNLKTKENKTILFQKIKNKKKQYNYISLAVYEQLLCSWLLNGKCKTTIEIIRTKMLKKNFNKLKKKIFVEF